MPKFLGIIPARYASSRLPGKPLADINGKTMLEHVYRRALISDVFFRIIIATDDKRIYEAAEKFGAEAAMTREDHPNGTSRAAEIASAIDTDYVINIQGDEPMLDPRLLRELADGIAADESADSATACMEITDEEDINNPNIVKVARALNGRALYFSRSPLPYRREATGCKIYEHIGIYAYKKDFLMKLITLPDTPLQQTESLEQLKILEHGYSMAVIPTKYPSEGPNINTPEDLELVRKILAGK
ncbi:MAG: 3-deoxy-manno-octulosonate cytidylyltransferase [Synergistaceae bacterium]|nr:3-deoxy-manno-octulosonate cytidylyltransferase [Candidatus Equadaptatus faecalis]MDO4952481.1 3-deoxy-manno-octulosonate cytidylyltransferase [Synergistaceae bacterium]